MFLDLEYYSDSVLFQYSGRIEGSCIDGAGGPDLTALSALSKPILAVIPYIRLWDGGTAGLMH